MIHDADPGICIHCGQAVTMVADEKLDEWRWAGADGKTTGRDSDLAHLYDPARNPLGATSAYDALSRMAAMMDAASQAAKNPRKASLTPLYWRVAREYSALSVRLDMSLSFHQHMAWTEPWTGPPAPYHCGSPGWLRPSGWHCRECRMVLTLAVV
jgi:hypothetical protein